MSYQNISGSVSQSEGFFSKLFGDSNGSSLMKGSANLLACMNSAQANLLFADTKFTLVHANNKSIETLRKLEGDIKEIFSLTVDEMIGGSIHRFHRDPRRIENILKNPANLPHIAEFTFGKALFQPPSMPSTVHRGR
ncbi:MAG: hypothetical protein HOF21_05345 [Nitrospina sp.]|nr:hypothetical protein [Nitrospina sp.]MBT5633837.1 hypothetical protein [Nitrospina sp.]